MIFFQVHTLRVPPFALYTHNTSITEWELERRDGFHAQDDTAKAGPARWRLVHYNDDYHIRDMPDNAESSPYSAAEAMEDGDS
jgi:hypothetical protein